MYNTFRMYSSCVSSQLVVVNGSEAARVRCGGSARVCGEVVRAEARSGDERRPRLV